MAKIAEIKSKQMKGSNGLKRAVIDVTAVVLAEIATMDVMVIMDAMPIMTMIAQMATMTNNQCQYSRNNDESGYIWEIL